MHDENVLNGFMDGFAKAAEDAGIHDEGVLELLKLSIDLAQRGSDPDSFDAGFAAAVTGV